MKFRNLDIRWLLPACIALFGLLMIGPMHQFAGLPIAIAWKEALADVISLSLAISLMIWVVKSYPTRVGIMVYALVAGLFAGALAAQCNYLLLRWLLEGGNINFQAWWLSSRVDRMLIAQCISVSCGIITAMSKRLRVMDERFRQQTSAEILLREAELFKLRQQLQPHFLYNSLNAINSLVLISPDKAQEMVGKLSDFLRSSVRKEGNDLSSVDDELAYTKLYLDIESIRFGDRLRVVYEKSYTDDARLPPFLLQPLIENAIKFGLYGKTGEVIISMKIWLALQMLTIEITNPFDPLMRPPAGTGFGLEGVRRRLYLVYSREDLLETSITEDTFTTIIKIPQ